MNILLSLWGLLSTGNLAILIGSLSAASAAPAASTTSSSSTAASTTVTTTTSSSALPTTAAYFVSGTSTTIVNTTLVATGTDEGVIIVKESGVAYLTDVSLIKTGNTTGSSDSSFTDLNAAVGVETKSTIYLRGSKIQTDGLSANGLHTYQDDSVAYMYDCVVDASGDGSHGIYVAGGAIYGENLYISTANDKASAIATDQGGGTIVVGKVEAYTYGEKSALVYSTGNITVDKLRGTSAQAPAAVIDGQNSWTLNNPSISSGPLEHGVFQFQSTVAESGDVYTAQAYVTGGSVKETRGDHGLVFAGNIIVDLYLTDVETEIKSGILANASADSQWGDTDENGGTANIYLTGMDISGDIYVDDISEVNLYLYSSNWKGAFNVNLYLYSSNWKGAFNVNNSTGNATIYLDASSTWTLTGDSSVDTITDESSTFANIRTGNYSLSYDSRVSV